MKKENEPFIINVIQDLLTVTKIVNDEFKDEQKTTQWMNTPFPLLGNKDPTEMIFSGQTERLIRYIKIRIQTNEL